MPQGGGVLIGRYVWAARFASTFRWLVCQVWCCSDMPLQERDEGNETNIERWQGRRAEAMRVTLHARISLCRSSLRSLTQRCALDPTILPVCQALRWTSRATATAALLWTDDGRTSVAHWSWLACRNAGMGHRETLGKRSSLFWHAICPTVRQPSKLYV
jgi:hypothetical protein